MAEARGRRWGAGVLGAVMGAGLLLGMPAELMAGLFLGNKGGVNTFRVATQQSPAVAVSGSGDFIVAWTSWDGIRARRFDAATNPLGMEFVVRAADPLNFLEDAGVGMDAAGNHVIVWSEATWAVDGSPLGKDILVQRFDGQGTTLGGFRADLSGGNDYKPAVAMNASGTFVVAWTSHSDFMWSVHAVIYDAQGRVRAAVQVVPPTDLDDPGEPGVAINAAGDFVVAWELQGEVRAATFTANGGPISPRVLVTTSGERPAAGIDGFGRFVVAWEDPQSVSVQRFEPDGSPLGGATTVNDVTQSPFAWDAAVATGATGEFLVVAHADDPNDVGHVIGHYFEADGTSTGPMLVGSADPFSSVFFARHPAVAMTTKHVVTAWTVNDSSGSFDKDIVAQTFFSDHVANTAAGPNVAVTPASLASSPVSLTFSTVTQAGDTVLSQGSTGPPPPGNFRLGDPAVYYELSTTAIFSGSVQVCINYTGITFTGAPELFHFENGSWVALPNATVDPLTKVVCADTTSFSPFALMATADATPPVITATVSGTAGNNGWYRSDVTVTWSVVDPDSEISSSTGCDAVIVASDTAGTTVTCSATSAGGEASESVTVKRDATPPTIVIAAPSDGAVYELNQPVAASYGCTDDLSGPALCAGPVASGSGLDTSSAGNRTFTVDAADQAGNATLRSATYEVRAGCHYVSLGLSPSTVPQGGWTSVSATLRSCAATAQRVAIRFVLEGPAAGGARSVLFTTPPFTLPAGTAWTVSFPFRVPSGAPPGAYSITATTLVDGAAVDTTAASLTVMPR